MWRMMRQLKNAKAQTKFFAFTVAIYMLALVWTTFQSYARLAFNRSDRSDPIIINIPAKPDK